MNGLIGRASQGWLFSALLLGVVGCQSTATYYQPGKTTRGFAAGATMPTMKSASMQPATDTVELASMVQVEAEDAPVRPATTRHLPTDGAVVPVHGVVADNGCANCATNTSYASGVACGVNGCGPGCQSVPVWDAVRQKLHSFDYEQLHPDHCWPQQYSKRSRNFTNAFFHDQIVAGNLVEVTLNPYHFSDRAKSEHLLNGAGESRIRYLTRRKPYIIPFIRLQTSFDPELDAKRTQTIRERTAHYSQLSPMASSFTVVLVNEEPSGFSGEEVARAFEKLSGGQQALNLIVPVYEGFIKSGFRTSGGTGLAGQGN